MGFADVDLIDWQGDLQLAGGRPALEAAEFGLSAFWSEELPPSNPNYMIAMNHLAATFKDYEIDSEVVMPARVRIVTGGF